MNVSRYLIGSLIVFATFFLYEGLLHAVILYDAYDSIRSIMRPEGDQVMFFARVMLAECVLAFGLGYIFVKGYQNRGIMEGVRFGLLMGLPFGIFFYLSQSAVYPIPFTLMLSISAGFVIEVVIAGIIFAAIYKPKK